MNILVITRAAWNNDNNIGNTMTNIFSGFQDDSINNLYFRSDCPNNDICKSAFQLTEMQMVKTFFNRKATGSYIAKNQFYQSNIVSAKKEKKIYDFSKKHDFKIFWFIREIIWQFGNWKSPKLDDYLHTISPDIIFMPVFGCFYPHKILKYIKLKTKSKVILFHADDNYTLKQYSLSPLYWLYRFILRKWVKHSVSISDINYVISDIQKQEYEKAFHKNCILLMKGGNFTGEAPVKEIYNSPLKLVFTGNIGTGRWKSLSALGEALDKINSDSTVDQAYLYIYSLSPINRKMMHYLNKKSIKLMGGIPACEVELIQRDADILVHAEALNLKERLQVRQSFSTKIVDYFFVSRCIFAIGSLNMASIDYLIKSDAAVIANTKGRIYDEIRSLISDHNKMTQIAKKAWECGKRNHNQVEIKRLLRENFLDLIER